jgi:hypothetical protein
MACIVSVIARLQRREGGREGETGNGEKESHYVRDRETKGGGREGGGFLEEQT